MRLASRTSIGEPIGRDPRGRARASAARTTSVGRLITTNAAPSDERRRSRAGPSADRICGRSNGRVLPAPAAHSRCALKGAPIQRVIDQRLTSADSRFNTCGNPTSLLVNSRMLKHHLANRNKKKSFTGSEFADLCDSKSRLIASAAHPSRAIEHDAHPGPFPGDLIRMITREWPGVRSSCAIAA